MEERKWKDRLETPLNACSLEILHSHVHMQFMVIGCYELQDDGVRTGELRLHQMEEQMQMQTDTDTNADSSLVASLFGEPIQVISTPYGILDGKWFSTSHENTHDKDGACDVYYYYVAATSVGHVDLYQLVAVENNGSGGSKQNKPFFRLELLTSSEGIMHHDDKGVGGLCLALDVSPDGNRIVSSYSNGYVAIHTLIVTQDDNSTVTLHQTHVWLAHVYSDLPQRPGAEVWTTCFVGGSGPASSSSQPITDDKGPVATTCVLSGGDDGRLKLWTFSFNDANHDDNDDDGSHSESPHETVLPLHHAGADTDDEVTGVTCLSRHPTHSHLVVLGNYGGDIYLYNHASSSLQRMTKQRDPVLLYRVGHGIWRLKWHPTAAAHPQHSPPDNESASSSLRLLVAAMHGGCRILSLPPHYMKEPDSTRNSYRTFNDTDSASATLITEFTQHKSMAYGADWYYCTTNHDEDVQEFAASCSFYDRTAFLWDSHANTS